MAMALQMFDLFIFVHAGVEDNGHDLVFPQPFSTLFSETSFQATADLTSSSNLSVSASSALDYWHATQL